MAHAHGVQVSMLTQQGQEVHTRVVMMCAVRFKLHVVGCDNKYSRCSFGRIIKDIHQDKGNCNNQIRKVIHIMLAC